MTNLKDKIKNSWNWIKENPKKTIAGIGLAGLIATTALKDNVHFGSVTLNNPQENHYVWGISPITEIDGENSKGNIYTFGLLFGTNGLGYNSKITGNMGAYGLGFGGNKLEYNSKITGNISNKGLVVLNSIKGFSIGSNDVKGLENYIHKGETN